MTTSNQPSTRRVEFRLSYCHSCHTRDVYVLRRGDMLRTQFLTTCDRCHTENAMHSDEGPLTDAAHVHIGCALSLDTPPPAEPRD